MHQTGLCTGLQQDAVAHVHGGNGLVRKSGRSFHCAAVDCDARYKAAALHHDVSALLAQVLFRIRIRRAVMELRLKVIHQRLGRIRRVYLFHLGK